MWALCLPMRWMLTLKLQSPNSWPLSEPRVQRRFASCVLANAMMYHKSHCIFKDLLATKNKVSVEVNEKARAKAGWERRPGKSERRIEAMLKIGHGSTKVAVFLVSS